MLPRLLLVFVLSLLVHGCFDVAKASAQSLQTFFNQVQSLQADFDQLVVDENGMTLDSSQGVFSLQRPGKFRWNYLPKDDYSEQGQQIISDGDWITFFDPDLETANQRSLQQALKQVPTLALVQSGVDAGKFFTISDYGLTDGLFWFGLKPKDPDAVYQGLLIGFKNEELRTILLTDGLGNETKLSLRNVKTNIELAPSLFEFSAGENIDVIRE